MGLSPALALLPDNVENDTEEHKEETAHDEIFIAGHSAIEKEFRYARKKIRANVSKKEAPVRSALSKEAGPVGAGHAASGGPSRPPEWSPEQAGTSCT